MTQLVSKAFWQTTAENAVIGAAGGAATPLAAHATDLLNHVPWDYVGSGAGLGAVLAVLYSLASLKRNNGVASFSPNVVALGHGWDPVETNPANT